LLPPEALFKSTANGLIANANANSTADGRIAHANANAGHHEGYELSSRSFTAMYSTES